MSNQSKVPAAPGLEGTVVVPSSLGFLKESIATMLLVAVIALVAQFFVAPDQMERKLVPMMVIGFVLVSGHLLRIGKILPSKCTLAGGVWLTMTLAAVFSGGVRAPVMMTYPVIILSAAWMIHARAALVVTALTVLATIAMGVADSWNLLPTPLPSSTVMYVGDQIVVYGISAMLSVLLVRNYRRRVSELNKVIAEREQAVSNLRLRDERFELLFDRAVDGIVLASTSGNIVAVNQSFASMHGYVPREMLNLNIKDLDTPDTTAEFQPRIERILSGEGLTFEARHLHKDGHVIPVEVSCSLIVSGQERLIQAFHRDISQRQLAQAQINELAFYDPLTKLPNRRLLLDRLNQAIRASGRQATRSALLFVDLDNFKTLNDSKGHLQGDALLVQVAQRLITCIRKGDTVARLGSDEFVVLLVNLGVSELEAASQSRAVAEQIQLALGETYALDCGTHHSSTSIGISLFGGDLPESSLDVLKRGELAMYQAKAAGRNALRFFDPAMQVDMTKRAALEAELHEAILHRQLVLFYQSQVIDAGCVTGVEALLRWRHPTRGLVSPGEFIALAEESGLILPIGQFVLESACRQLALWAEDPGLAHLTMAVNVSARQFQQKDFVAQVVTALDQSGANPKQLKIELTESMLVQEVESVIAKMGRLKEMGVKFSLDDFGTGYSSLAYLKRLPLDQLKIDQGFVRDILTDPNDAAIAKMVVVLADSLGLAVIAEGVELQAQRDVLAGLGCHAYQGYLFSRPLPLDAFEEYLRRA